MKIEPIISPEYPTTGLFALPHAALQIPNLTFFKNIIPQTNFFPDTIIIDYPAKAALDSIIFFAPISAHTYTHTHMESNAEQNGQANV